jgi:hypothetical protein
MRAFFAEGVDKMHVPWAVEGLPTLLHLSLFLFFGGLAIFLFEVDREVFSYVIWWIGLFSLVYGMITLLPLIRQDSPYNSPLSTPTWFFHATVTYVTVKILSLVIKFCFCFCAFFCSCFFCCFCFCFYDPYHRIRRIETWVLTHIGDLGKCCRRRMLGGVERAAEETVLERISKIDVCILDWTITTLGDDDSLKNFFEAIPGFFNSKLVNHLGGDFTEELFKKYRDALDGFLGRTWSSNSVNDSEKFRRLDIATNAMSLIRNSAVSSIYRDEMLQVTMARILLSVRKRDDRWITLAARVFDLPERYLRDNIALGGDSVLLAIFIDVTRRSLHFDYPNWMVLKALSKLDIRNTLPRLQHDFCTLWNEIVKKARKRGPCTTPFSIIFGIRHLYIALHQGTDALPIEFSVFTDYYAPIVPWPSSYPLCNIASHRPDSTPHLSVPLPDALSPSPTDGDNTASRQAEQGNNVIEPPSPSNPMTTSEIGATSHTPDIIPPTNPVHSSSRPAGASPTVVVAAAPQDITSTFMLSHPLEGSEQQDSDIVAPSAEPGTDQTLSTTSTHAPTPTLAPIPTSLPITLESYAGVASVSNFSNFAPPSIRCSIPASRPTGSATLPLPLTRGLLNTTNMCFANAVLQLLVNLPPLRTLFRELGDLKEQRGAGVPEAGGGATPLVDATVRFFKEFIVEESPSTQQQSQLATGGTSRADKEEKDDNIVDGFEPSYMYDAMKEKRQLKPLLVRSRAHVAASCY